jgi:hypothetical protein
VRATSVSPTLNLVLRLFLRFCASTGRAKMLVLVRTCMITLCPCLADPPRRRHFVRGVDGIEDLCGLWHAIDDKSGLSNHLVYLLVCLISRFVFEARPLVPSFVPRRRCQITKSFSVKVFMSILLNDLARGAQAGTSRSPRMCDDELKILQWRRGSTNTFRKSRKRLHPLCMSWKNNSTRVRTLGDFDQLS